MKVVIKSFASDPEFKVEAINEDKLTGAKKGDTLTETQIKLLMQYFTDPKYVLNGHYLNIFDGKHMLLSVRGGAVVKLKVDLENESNR